MLGLRPEEGVVWEVGPLALAIDAFRGVATHDGAEPTFQVAGRGPAGQSICGLSSGAVTAQLQGAETTLTAPVDATVKGATLSGVVDAAGQFSGTLAALGGEAAATGTASKTTCQLGGTTDFAVPTTAGAVPLTEGTLTYAWTKNQGPAKVLVSATLTVFETPLEVDGWLANDGTFFSKTDEVQGEVVGLKTGDLGAILSEDGVTVEASFVLDGLFDTEVEGSWLSDDDFLLTGESTGQPAGNVVSTAALTLAPGGATVAATLTGALTGSLSGPAWGEGWQIGWALSGPGALWTLPATLEWTEDGLTAGAPATATANVHSTSCALQGAVTASVSGGALTAHWCGTAACSDGEQCGPVAETVLDVCTVFGVAADPCVVPLSGP